MSTTSRPARPRRDAGRIDEYGVEHSEVRAAAALRAKAMDMSDRWVAAGCVPGDPLPAEERALLIRSFAALLVAVHRPPTVRTVTATP